jgi:hypothetical protein
MSLAEFQTMDHPLWMLVPWAVFAVAAGLKMWRLGLLLRPNRMGTPSTTEQMRRSLERSWAKDQQAA